MGVQRSRCLYFHAHLCYLRTSQERMGHSQGQKPADTTKSSAQRTTSTCWLPPGSSWFLLVILATPGYPSHPGSSWLPWRARRSQEEPGRAKRNQEKPGEDRKSQEEPRGARRSQEEPGRARGSQREPGRARGSQEEPGGARRSQEEPGGPSNKRQEPGRVRMTRRS